MNDNMRSRGARTVAEGVVVFAGTAAAHRPLYPMARTAHITAE